MSMTYTSLSRSIGAYLDRTDDSTLSKIPQFIEHAQYDLNNACKTIGQEDYIVSNFIPGIDVYQKPVGWRRNLSINVGTGTSFNTREILDLEPYEYLRIYTPNPADATAWTTPKFYADYGFTNFLVAPVPDLVYPFELCYMKIPDLISEQNQTNWWTNFAPNVLFSACMEKAHAFLENFDKAAFYKAETREGIDKINKEDEIRTVDRASVRQAD
jgi:hypothetical protein